MNKYLFKFDNLGFRPVLDSDIDYLIRLDCDPDIKKFFPGGALTEDKIPAKIKEYQDKYKKQGYGCYLVFDLLDDKFIGRAGISDLESGETEVGYLIVKELWGKEYATRIVRALLDRCKNNLHKDKVIAFTPVDHKASERVMQKAGMTYATTKPMPNVPGECVIYEFYLNKAMKQGKIQSDKFKLGYAIEGEGKETALIIGSSIYYPRTFSANLGKHLRLVFVDHRGFAEYTGKVNEQGFALDLILDDIEKVRQELKLGKIIIIGHSGHGFMALEYAKKYQDSVSKVVLIAMGPSNSFENQKLADEYFKTNASSERMAAQNQSLEKLDSDIKANPERRFIAFCIRLGPRSWYDYTFDATFLWNGVKVNMVALDYLWGEVFASIDITKGLEDFNLPVLLVLGKHDYLVAPYYTWDNIKDKFKNLKVKLFDKSSHTPQMEEAEKFDSLLVDFIER